MRTAAASSSLRPWRTTGEPFWNRKARRPGSKSPQNPPTAQASGRSLRDRQAATARSVSGRRRRRRTQGPLSRSVLRSARVEQALLLSGRKQYPAEKTSTASPQPAYLTGNLPPSRRTAMANRGLRETQVEEFL